MSGQIRNSWWKIAALAVAVGGLGTLAWLLPQDAAQDDHHYLLPPELEIRAITVQRDDTRIALQRHASGWQLEGGVAASRQAARFASALQSPASQRYAASEFDLAAVGLAPPRAIARVNDDTRLELGDYSGIGQQRYVKVGEHVYLASPLVGYYMEQSPDFFRTEADGQD